MPQFSDRNVDAGNGQRSDAIPAMLPQAVDDEIGITRFGGQGTQQLSLSCRGKRPIEAAPAQLQRRGPQVPFIEPEMVEEDDLMRSAFGGEGQFDVSSLGKRRRFQRTANTGLEPLEQRDRLGHFVGRSVIRHNVLVTRLAF